MEENKRSKGKKMLIGKEKLEEWPQPSSRSERKITKTRGKSCFLTVNTHHSVCGAEGCRNMHFRNKRGQTAVCRGVPELWLGDGVCSEEDSEWAEASLCRSSTLLWSSALRNSSSFRLWCTGTCNRTFASGVRIYH